MSRQDEIITLELKIHARTDRAVLVTDTDDEDDEDAPRIWLPLAQIEIVEKANGTASIDMPEWLAEDRGLI
jgi:hypothetical protein